MPNLHGLRAFDVAARELSMKAAAAQLHVTPSAVSQLIRALEAELGVALFARGNRRLALTPAGQTLLPAVRQGFKIIGEASESLRREPDGTVLTVSTTASFAQTWLIPRLSSFAERFPKIDLRIVSGAALSTLRDGEADAAIRHGLGTDAGMRTDLLVAPPIVPVAAAPLLATHGSPRSAADLLAWPKVHDADRKAWSAWFAHHGVVGAQPPRGPSFDDAALLAAATRHGRGAALLPLPVAEALVRDDAVEMLADPAVIDPIGYHLVVPVSAASRPLLVAFRLWLLEELAQPAR